MTCAWNEVLQLLPSWLRSQMDKDCESNLREIRLRLGKSVQINCGQMAELTGRKVTLDDLKYIVNMACRYSPWTASGASEGYITAPGGHRVGLCGDAVIHDGIMQGIRTATSLNIRVARDFPGIAENLKQVRNSVLIIGKPGSGKTTLLRDLIRQLSEMETVSVVDERGELFPVSNGRNCFDTGKSVDILSGCRKQQGIGLLLRTMTPDTIAVDEITQSDDCAALMRAGWCGVRLLATAHAATKIDLLSREVYKPLVQTGLFHTLVVLHADGRWHTERMTL